MYESTKPVYFRAHTCVSKNYRYIEKFVNLSYVSYSFLVCVWAERSATRTAYICGFCLYFYLIFLFVCFYFDRGEYILATSSSPHLWHVYVLCLLDYAQSVCSICSLTYIHLTGPVWRYSNRWHYRLCRWPRLVKMFIASENSTVLFVQNLLHLYE